MQNKSTTALMQTSIEAALSPSQLTIIDDSADHIGHSGPKPGQGHFSVIIASPAFANKSLVASHRLIYDALGELMQTHIHALRIEILN